MDEYIPTKEFETEIRSAVQTPPVRAEFVQRLENQLLDISKSKASINKNILILRPAWIAIAVIFLLFSVILIIGPERVLAAARNLAGYLPEIGVVQNDSSLRLLVEPVEVTRDGITVTVENGASDDQHCIIVYQADGLSLQAANSHGESAVTGGIAVLRLPDGSILTQTEGSANGWGSGYRQRLVFPPLPPNILDVTLMISRLETMPALAAPENWELKLMFNPAPADTSMMPVYQIESANPVLETDNGLPVQEQSEPVMADQSFSKGIRLQLTQVITLESGYQLEGVLNWETESYSNVFFDPFASNDFLLLDGNGERIPAQFSNPQFYSDTQNAKQTGWAIRTNDKNFISPWTLNVPQMMVDQNLKSEPIPFQIDFGQDPQTGFSREINQPLTIEGRELVLASAALLSNDRDGNPELEFVFRSEAGIYQVNIDDPDNQAVDLRNGVSTESHGDSFTVRFLNYQPLSGVNNFSIVGVSYGLDGPWQVTWDAPQTTQEAKPTPVPQTCLTSETWQLIKDLPAADLPEGLNGRLLVENHIGQLMPQMELWTLDGSLEKTLAIGGWSSLSPDGKWAVYIISNGPSLFLQNTLSGDIQAIPNTTPEDYHPLWSADGQWIAFTRSFSGTYIIHPDGSGLQQVLDASRITTLAGWLPDNRGIVLTALTPDGSQVQSVDLQNGAVENMFVIDSAKGGFPKISPDGKRIAFSEMTFGQQSYGVYTAKLDGSNKRLVIGLETGGASAIQWSPDGNWISATISALDGSADSTVVVALDTCQVFKLANINGQIVSWGSEP
jgi:hypothetical protein